MLVGWKVVVMLVGIREKMLRMSDWEVVDVLDIGELSMWIEEDGDILDEC